MKLQERLDRLEPRERRLLNLLVIVFVVFVGLLVPAGIMTMLSTERGENEELRGAVQAVQDGRLAVQKRNEKQQSVLRRYAKPAPGLAGFLEKQAKQASVEIPESQDRPVVPHGKQYEERSNKIVLRRVGMFNLVKFMERIAKSGHPVTISRLNIRRRGVGNDTYDVQMIVSAFDRKASGQEKAPSEEEETEAEEETETEEPEEEEVPGEPPADEEEEAS